MTAMFVRLERNASADVNDDELSEPLRTQVREYRSTAKTLLQRERAEREASLWEMLPRELRQKCGRGAGPNIGEFLVRYTIGVAVHGEHRRMLWLMGEAATPLWERVDASKGSMPLSTAARVARQAKVIAATGKPLTDAVKQALAEYDKKPAVVLPNGSVVRRASINGYRREAPATPSVKDVAVVEVQAPPKKKPRGEKSGGFRSGAVGRKTVAEVRDLLEEYVKGRLEEAGGGVDVAAVQDALRETMIEIDVALGTLRRAVARIIQANRVEARLSEMTSRGAMERAMRTLNLEPPEPGEKIDMDIVREHKRRLARQYHPDMHHGKTDTVAKYDAVINAYNTVSAWVEEHPEVVKRKK